MKATAQKIHASTQRFTEIRDIRENIVLLHGGNACLVIEVASVNFALLSSSEQDAKVSAYASLLNSLSFPVEILIRSKQIDITPYILSLNREATQTQNPKLKESIKQYAEFVEQTVKTKIVLDKKFYFVIGFSSIEGSVKTASVGLVKDPPIDAFFQEAKDTLNTKADSLLAEIGRLGLKTTVLQKEDLMKLFHDVYNESVLTLEKEGAK